MGQRANLIVARDDGYELFYSHWRASTLDRDLFWGPEAALAFVRAQRSTAEGADWLDEAWAEGGAVLDPQRRTLLWYGGQDVMHDVPLRRVHLGILAASWDGWAVSWAHEGLADLARAVGHPVEAVLVAGGEPEPPPGPPQDPSWIDTAVTVAELGEVRILASDADPDTLAALGPALLDAARRHGTRDPVDWAVRTFPRGGVHLDVERRQVEVWLAAPWEDRARRLAAAWPGWTVIDHADRYEGQLAAAGGRLTFPRVDEEALVAKVRARVLAEDRDHSGLVPALAAGKPVDWVNAFALRDDVPAAPLAPAERFAAALARWRRGRQ